MMGVINMAHGEFIMCGAYVTVGLVHAGLPLPIAQLCGTLAAALIGVLVEVAIVRRFYERPLDSLLATWGLSLLVTQGMLLVVGSSLQGIGTPPGSFKVGDYTFSTYRLVLFAGALFALGFIYVIFMRTRFGILARATMQNATMAQNLGVRVGRIYAVSFGIGAGLAAFLLTVGGLGALRRGSAKAGIAMMVIGAGLAGFCGALYAPTMTLIPTMGASFIVESFVTVVVGGSNVLLGTAPAGIFLAAVRTALNAWAGQIVGQIGMLIAVMVIIRILPEGVTGYITRRQR